MSDINFRDGGSRQKYRKATGTGEPGDPYVPETGVRDSLDNSDIIDLLGDVVKELKKINMHLYIMTDTCITDTEIE